MASSIPLRVISGGQTGADQAALFAARACGLATGGWAPKDYLTSDGLAPWQKEFGVKEMSTRNYVARSIRNVQESDATVAFRTHTSTGTDKTIGYVLTKKWQVVTDLSKSYYKPMFIVNDISSVTQHQVMVNFLKDNNIGTVNICGHRESDSLNKHWTRDVENFLVTVFTALK